MEKSSILLMGEMPVFGIIAVLVVVVLLIISVLWLAGKFVGGSASYESSDSNPTEERDFYKEGLEKQLTALEEQKKQLQELRKTTFDANMALMKKGGQGTQELMAMQEFSNGLKNLAEKQQFLAGMKQDAQVNTENVKQDIEKLKEGANKVKEIQSEIQELENQMDAIREKLRA